VCGDLPAASSVRLSWIHQDYRTAG
jgi:hypothetical protein